MTAVAAVPATSDPPPLFSTTSDADSRCEGAICAWLLPSFLTITEFFMSIGWTPCECAPLISRSRSMAEELLFGTIEFMATEFFIIFSDGYKFNGDEKVGYPYMLYRDSDFGNCICDFTRFCITAAVDPSAFGGVDAELDGTGVAVVDLGI